MQDLDFPQIEWEDSGLPDDGLTGIVIPDMPAPLTTEQLSTLKEAIDPKAESQCFGCDIYIAAVQFCEHMMSSWNKCLKEKKTFFVNKKHEDLW